ncbi:aspartate-semialdehyde dehydrogenase [Streptomyces sp. LamerLS-316]|uniref:aspartate-semialdehyde dehydrogenase n=1 Tax=unclassified Streptomyces TaxID=2593676 RepID=UPI000823EF44|nr:MULTISPECIES: aspartate-semialdehyde dehydrogenase [unclassified Streptomyces]MYQ39270.1 aspartate-semialdehyde dehydrogenase [Streptomyces sp. SID4921]SCK42053.1 aspartate-semialdehyde dehydrogenase [Streptomyces sp. LamerLS-316]
MTLVTDPTAPRIAIIGATGAVGSTLIELIEERDLRYRELYLVASSRSAGRRIPVGGQTHEVRSLEDFDFGLVDIAFFSAGTSVSRAWVPAAVAKGALVIDNTRAYRMDPDTPLVVPQINYAVLDRPPGSGVIANPNCSTIPLVRVLQPVERRWGIRQVVVSTYQAASGQGHQGIEELLEGTEVALRDPDADLPSERFSPPLAFNVVPFVDELQDSGFTLEEQKMVQESRKILGLPDLDVTATCVRVPVVNSHSEAVWVQTQEPVDRAELVGLLSRQTEVTVHDAENRAAFPTPLKAGHPDHVHVGRVRVSPHDPRGFWLWLVSDNLRVGAALNAVQIAEYALARGFLSGGVR